MQSLFIDGVSDHLPELFSDCIHHVPGGQLSLTQHPVPLGAGLQKATCTCNIFMYIRQSDRFTKRITKVPCKLGYRLYCYLTGRASTWQNIPSHNAGCWKWSLNWHLATQHTTSQLITCTPQYHFMYPTISYYTIIIISHVLHNII